MSLVEQVESLIDRLEDLDEELVAVDLSEEINTAEQLKSFLDLHRVDSSAESARPGSLNESAGFSSSEGDE